MPIVSGQSSSLVKGQPARPLPPAPVLDVLAWVADAHQQLNTAEHLLTAAVTRARQSGQPWSAIGTQLGITRQAAQQRFAPRASVHESTNPLRGHIDVRQWGVSPGAAICRGRAVSRQAQLHLQRTIAYVRHDIQPAALQAPLPASTASRFLAASVLHTYPNTAITTATVEDHHDAHPSTVARAVAFIETKPDLELTVTDNSPRGLRHPPRPTTRVPTTPRHHTPGLPTAGQTRPRLPRPAHRHRSQRPAASGQRPQRHQHRRPMGLPGSRFSHQYRAAYGQHPNQTLNQ